MAYADVTWSNDDEVTSEKLQQMSDNDTYCKTTLDEYLPRLSPAPLFYAFTTNSLTSTLRSPLYQQASILSLPYDYTMVVRYSGRAGFSVADNIIHFVITDNRGQDINLPFIADEGFWFHGIAGKLGCFDAVGKADYAAGETCGFGVDYWLSNDNAYFFGTIELHLYPR